MKADMDDGLLDDLRAGDNAARERFVRANISWMLALARRLTQDPALAEDCVQEAFFNAFRHIDGFQQRSSLRTWLHRILVNQAMSKLRTRERKREASIDEFMPLFDQNACRIEAPWPSIADPEEILDREDRRQLVQMKIEELPDSFRIIVQLRDIEELSTREVAEGLGLSEANVKVRLHRARSALKKLLEPMLRGEA